MCPGVMVSNVCLVCVVSIYMMCCVHLSYLSRDVQHTVNNSDEKRTKGHILTGSPVNIFLLVRFSITMRGKNPCYKIFMKLQHKDRKLTKLQNSS